MLTKLYKILGTLPRKSKKISEHRKKLKKRSELEKSSIFGKFRKFLDRKLEARLPVSIFCREGCLDRVKTFRSLFQGVVARVTFSHENLVEMSV